VQDRVSKEEADLAESSVLNQSKADEQIRSELTQKDCNPAQSRFTLLHNGAGCGRQGPSQHCSCKRLQGDGCGKCYSGPGPKHVELCCRILIFC
jgi:hypothetical protein